MNSQVLKNSGQNQFYGFLRYCIFLIAIWSIIPAVQAQTHSAVTPAPRESDYWLARFNDINAQIKQGHVDLLFVGDSITHWWQGRVSRDGESIDGGKAIWAEYYSKRNAANIGIAGDRTEHVLWRLQNGNIDGISPKVAVLMIGTNNSRTNTAEEIADGIVAVVSELRSRLPTTKVLLLAIFPRGEKPDERREMLATASKLAAARVVDGEAVHYLDINSHFLTQEGILSAEIMPDFLHPSEKGYQIWASAMEPKIQTLMMENH